MCRKIRCDGESWKILRTKQGPYVTSPVPVNSGTRTSTTPTRLRRPHVTGFPSPCQPQPEVRKARGPPNQKATTNETTSRLPRTASTRVAIPTTDAYAYPPPAAAAPPPRPRSLSPLVCCGKPKGSRTRDLRKPENETEARRTAPQRSQPTPPPPPPHSRSHQATTTTTPHLHHKVRVAPRLAPRRAARLVPSRPVPLGNPPTQSTNRLPAPACACVRAWRRLALPPPSPPATTPVPPGAPISRRVARGEEEVGGSGRDGGVRVAAQRVRGQAPHAAVRRRQRPLGRRRRGAAEAQPPRREGSEDGAIARRVHGDNPGGRRARLAVRRRSPDVQQPRVPRWVGGWTDGLLSPLSLSLSLSLALPVRLPPAACFGVWILISGGPWARDCALVRVKLNYCIWGSCASSNSYSLFLNSELRRLCDPVL